MFNIDQTQRDHAPQLYFKLLKFEGNPDTEQMISKDVSRTLSDLNLFREDLHAGNNKLFNVLKAYSNYDNEVSYVQGINYIVGILLFYIGDEEQVFWCLINLMQKKWKWRFIYTNGFPKLQQLLAVLKDRMQAEFPRILNHLNQNFLEIVGTFSPLFMTLFVYMTPLDVASKLFELFLIDGEHVLIRLILRMIELKQRKILAMADVDLQAYMLCGMVSECTKAYTLDTLLE